jgi:hypothetical protein
MSTTEIITADGDYILQQHPENSVTRSQGSTVMVIENSAAATLEYGMGDLNGDFVAYPDGTIAVGDIIIHGIGVVLMVRASGITADTVTIRVNPHA